MTAVAGQTRTAAAGARWIALTLVCLAAVLNYMDRQALSLLKPDLAALFHWTDTDYAHINSGFQLATIVSMLAAGWFVDRAGLRAGYAFGVGGWSLAQISHTIVSTVVGFFSVRVVLAATEAVNLPAAVKTVSAWFRDDARSLALGWMNFAPNIGAVMTPLVVPALAVTFGWRMAFIATGALGLFWLVLWLALPRPPPPLMEEAIAPPESYPDRNLAAFLRLISDRRTWAIALGKFLTDFVWVFLLFWGPDLFNKMYGLNQIGLSLPVALVFLMAGLGSLAAGWMSSRLSAKGKGFTRARRQPMILAAVLGLPVLLVAFSPNLWIAALLLGLALAAHQMFSTTIFGLATDIFPSRSVGLVIGLSAAFAGLAGLAINEYTGYVLSHHGSYASMLAICAVAKVAAVIVVSALVPNVDRAREKMLAETGG